MRELPTPIATKLYAAAELIADQGFDHTKIDDIAEVSGVPKATLYYYFAGKEEILAFLLKDLLTMIAGEVAAAVAAPGTASDRLAGAIKAQLGVMLGNPAPCRALIGDLGRATRLPALATALTSAFFEPVERLLRDGAEDGSLRPVDDRLGTAVTIFGAVTVSGLMHAVQNTDPDIDQIATTISDLLLRGLSPE
jgi:TetR/AcrR family transcriptional regulator